MNIKVKQTKRQKIKVERREKPNKTPNNTTRSTNNNKKCINIKSKKSNDNNKHNKKQEQAPLKPAHQAVNMARVQLGGGAPRLHHLVGLVVIMLGMLKLVMMMLMSASRCTWSPGAIISRQMGHFVSSSSSSSLYTIWTLLFSA